MLQDRKDVLLLVRTFSQNVDVLPYSGNLATPLMINIINANSKNLNLMFRMGISFNFVKKILKIFVGIMHSLTALFLRLF